MSVAYRGLDMRLQARGLGPEDIGEEVQNYRESGLPSRAPNSMNNYGLVLNEPLGDMSLTIWNRCLSKQEKQTNLKDYSKMSSRFHLLVVLQGLTL